MITQEQIQEYANRIVELFDPERIILFGSFANGTPRLDSDVDLLVEMSVDGDPIDKAVEIIKRVSPKLDVDILVRTPGTLERQAAVGDVVMSEILKHGRLMYARGN
jgi:predicted nucleotidyltransferase